MAGIVCVAIAMDNVLSQLKVGGYKVIHSQVYEIMFNLQTTRLVFKF
jgi:hypothetical protein